MNPILYSFFNPRILKSAICKDRQNNTCLRNDRREGEEEEGEFGRAVESTLYLHNITLLFKLSILLFNQVGSDRSLVMIDGAITIGVV